MRDEGVLFSIVEIVDNSSLQDRIHRHQFHVEVEHTFDIARTTKTQTTHDFPHPYPCILVQTSVSEPHWT